MASSYRFAVTGRVQGVGFRYSAASQAERLDLSGWVKNHADGSVEGIAQGDEARLQQFRQWLERGPPAARVSRVEWEPVVVEEMDSFGIR